MVKKNCIYFEPAHFGGAEGFCNSFQIHVMDCGECDQYTETKTCPCDLASAEECALCRDEGTLTHCFTMAEIVTALDGAGIKNSKHFFKLLEACK